jgi:hypothetical protein
MALARILTRSEGEALKVNGRRCTFCRQDQQRETSRMAEVAYCRICVLTLWQVSRATGHRPPTPEQRNGRQMLRERERELPSLPSLKIPCTRCIRARQGVEADGPKSEHRGRAPLAARRSQSSQVKRAKAWMPRRRLTPPRQTSLIHAGFRLCGLCGLCGLCA